MGLLPAIVAILPSNVINVVNPVTLRGRVQRPVMEVIALSTVDLKRLGLFFKQKLHPKRLIVATSYTCGGVGHFSRDCVKESKCYNCSGLVSH